MNVKEVFEEIKKNECLKTYWSYDDELSDEQLIGYITDEDFDFYEVFDTDYLDEEIDNIIKKYIDLDYSDEYYELRDEILSEWDYNFEELVKNSRIRLRIMFHTNEDMIDIRHYKKTDTYRKLVKLLKDKVDIIKFNEMFNDVCGTDYANLTFIMELSGSEINYFKEQYNKGIIYIPKNTYSLLFNNYVGAGSDIDKILTKDLFINKKWYSGSNYNISICSDDVRYGVQETYNLISSVWGGLND
jgi:hypothetical protein